MPAIKVDGIWKQYRYGTIGYGTLRHDLESWWARRRGREDPNRPVGAGSHALLGGGASDRFWALEGISFSVEPGEVVGIVGRNGAGKSTLLKVLSRITAPTLGRAVLKGRLASLLEIGTGFHPDLTGRQNVFLNGTILGMRRSEVARKLEEIVDFAGVEAFLDTPVKRYSSGMYLRLAFAVAAHLESEILAVDEVLAVGDAAFQRKCLGKMSETAISGRTVLFVSHNVNAVERLCSAVLWLEGGRLKEWSKEVSGVVVRYCDDGAERVDTLATADLPRSDWVDILSFGLRDAQGRPFAGTTRNDEQVVVRLALVVKRQDPALNVGYVLYDATGSVVFWSLTTDEAEENWPALPLGKSVLESAIPRRLLNEGVYYLALAVSLHQREWICRPEVTPARLRFEVRGGLSDSPYWTNCRPGFVSPVLRWRSVDDVSTAPALAESQ